MATHAPAPRDVALLSSDSVSRLHPWIAVAGLLIATTLAFLNGFGGVMVFDDRPSLIRNDTITDLTQVGRVLSPPLDTTLSGRPVANITFAVSHALAGGLEPFWYHVGNLVVHLLATLAFFGVVRRALELPSLRERFGQHAVPLAFVTALLWALHPLQTESVTYLVQRVEALVGFWYLLTLYCFLRSVSAVNTPAAAAGVVSGAATGNRAARWQIAGVLACLLGMGSKEVMVTAPLLVLLLDRTLIAESFGAALRTRWKFYLGLMATWGLLGALILGADSRSGTAGFGTASSWHYLLTQCRALVHYVRLAFWPDPLVFDYGKALETRPLAVAPQAALLVALGLATLWAIVRRSPWGVLGAFFFCVLGPSSSIVPVATQTMAEHRMYLALGAIVVAVVLAVHLAGARRAWPVWLVIAATLSAVTIHRNEAYSSELELWRITAAQRPENPRAQLTYGHALFEAGRTEEAIRYDREALRLDPNYWEAHNNLGIALLASHEMDEAVGHFAAAIRLDPEYAEAYNNLAMVLHARGDAAGAAKHCETAVKLRPNYAEAHSNLAIALLALGRPDDAERHARESIRLQPTYAEGHNNLGSALHALRRGAEAEKSFRTALQLKPAFPEAHHNLALTLRALDRHEEALEEFQRAVKARSGYVDAHNNLAGLLADLGRPDEAIAHYVAALEAEPQRANIHFNLGNLLLKLRRYTDALPACRTAAELEPAHAEAHSNLGTALFFTGDAGTAITEFQRAIELRPDFAKAHYFLGNVFASQSRFREARASYEAALRANPDYEPAKQNLARLPRAGGGGG